MTRETTIVMVTSDFTPKRLRPTSKSFKNLRDLRLTVGYWDDAGLAHEWKGYLGKAIQYLEELKSIGHLQLKTITLDIRAKGIWEVDRMDPVFKQYILLLQRAGGEGGVMSGMSKKIILETRSMEELAGNDERYSVVEARAGAMKELRRSYIWLLGENYGGRTS